MVGAPASPASSKFVDDRNTGGPEPYRIGRDLLVQPLERVGDQVAVFVDAAALGRHVAPERGQRLLRKHPAEAEAGV